MSRHRNVIAADSLLWGFRSVKTVLHVSSPIPMTRPNEMYPEDVAALGWVLFALVLSTFFLGVGLWIYLTY